MRKLPVYIVVDTSESMYGEAIDQVNKSLDNMLSSLFRNPYALETVWLSLITFDSIARVLVPLTELADFRLPELKARPGTAMGIALRLLRSQIEKEVTLSTDGDKGDWRPIVFLLTDGQPTDEWRQAAAALRAQRPKPANIYAIGVGEEIDFALLKEIADVTFQATDATPETLSKLFIWMSSAIQSASCNAGELKGDALATPDGIVEIGDDYSDAPTFPRQLFFHGVCSTTKQKYLMRLRWLDEIEMYVPVMSYKIPEDFLADGGYEPPEVSSDRIACMPVCPHCENEDWACCSNCNEGFCFDHVKASEGPFVVCPSCGARLAVGEGRSDSFSVRPSAG